MEGGHSHFKGGYETQYFAVNPENNLTFGAISQGPVYLKLQIYNVGTSASTRDLHHREHKRLMGSNSFSILPTPNTPLAIHGGGEHVEFTVDPDPLGAGAEEVATIRIISNDFPVPPT